MALPNGGLVAASLSGLLRIPVEVFIANDLRAPCHCPCTIGAWTETDVVYMDESRISRLYLELRAHIEREIKVQRAEIALQRQFLRSGCGLPDLTGRHVLFIDDGTAAPTTLFASIEAFRKLGAGKIVDAVILQFCAREDASGRFLGPVLKIRSN